MSSWWALHPLLKYTVCYNAGRPCHYRDKSVFPNVWHHAEWTIFFSTLRKAAIKWICYYFKSTINPLIIHTQTNPHVLFTYPKVFCSMYKRFSDFCWCSDSPYKSWLPNPSHISISLLFPLWKLVPSPLLFVILATNVFAQEKFGNDLELHCFPNRFTISLRPQKVCSDQDNTTCALDVNWEC